MSTELYKRMAAFAYEDADRGELMREVWSPTPWMVNVCTGGGRNDRDRLILDWCFKRFGQESSPIHGTRGRWHRGNATVMGWTWYGFATEVEMMEFVDKWPSPKTSEGVAA